MDPASFFSEATLIEIGVYISGEKIDNVLRRTGIKLVAGINPTTSRVIHRNIK